MPTFSVVIPVYNASATLPETLKSLARQSFTNYEVIFVNDGSTDDSEHIIRNWLDQPGRQGRIIRHENQGLGASRNRGIEAASGNWVAFLDADDLWDEDKLMELSQSIEYEKVSDVIYHRVINFNGQRKYPRAAGPVKDIRTLLTNSNPLVPSAVVLRRRLGLQYPFSEDRNLHGAEDLHLWVRLLNAGKHFHYTAEAVTYYRVKGGMSSDLENHLQYVFNALLVLQEEGIIDEGTRKAAVLRKHYEAGRFYQKEADFARAREHYGKGSIPDLKARLLILANRLGIAI